MKQRQQRKPDKRPDEILDAATRVFARRGFEGARMDDIAAQAGLSKGALYLYFASKSALLEAIVTRFAEQFASNLMTASVEAARVDPAAALTKLIERAAGFASDPDITLVPRLVLAEAHRDKQIAKLYRTRLLDQLEETVSQILAEGARRGLFRPVRTASLTRAFLGPMLAHMMLRHVFTVEGQAALAPHIFAQDLTEILLNGLCLEPQR